MALPKPGNPVVATHWGTYRATRDAADALDLRPIEGDADPSTLSRAMVDEMAPRSRILRPAIRRSFLEHGPRADDDWRGREPFVEVSWEEANALVARELDRVRHQYGNAAIFGGSYGWSSAGRFHHAQSQLHRFLNCIGGYTRSVNTYSYAAAEVLLPHVVGDHAGLVYGHSTWPVLAAHSKLIVLFGGAPRRNAQVNSGGLARHLLRDGLLACKANNAEFITISPAKDDTLAELGAEWMAPRPGSDTALILALAYVLLREELHDTAFLDRCTVGFDRFRAYLLGETDGVAKTPEWAAPLTEIAVEQIEQLARHMAATRTMIMMAWSLQRGEHGEQPYWAAIALACMLGQVGLPGGGFGFGYGAVNGVGNPVHGFSWPSLPQGRNQVASFIPVARIADLLLNPGKSFDYNGKNLIYPDIRLVYWAGGNPFHHHQDLNRLTRAWKRPETIIVHEAWWTATARQADIVLPVTTQIERNDIACSSRDRMITASHKVAEAPEYVRDDFTIFRDIASILGAEEAFTEGLDTEGWLRKLYDVAVNNARKADQHLADFETFWQKGMIALPEPEKPHTLFQAFRESPTEHPLRTPSGKIEIFSETIASFGYEDCPGHATWFPPSEWLGALQDGDTRLHLLSNQPATRLHSQYDQAGDSLDSKIAGREPLRMNPEDAAERQLSDGDVVLVSNERGACLAGLVIYPGLRRGVAQLATGAWLDPVEPGHPGSLDRHGNPNVLTRDVGTSRLGQGPIAQSCLVEITRWTEAVPAVQVFDPPPLQQVYAAE